MDFTSARQLQKLIGNYFDSIAGEWHYEDLPAKNKATDATTRQKVWDRESEPPTLSGLALYLGFESLQAFEDYEDKGRFANTLKRGRLQVEAEYEKKLHGQSAGVIFALKKLGWNDKPDHSLPTAAFNLQIELIETGHKPASNENEVKI